MDRVVITDKMIEDGMSDNGGLSNKQILLLSVGRTKGWRKRAIGKQIRTEQYQKFVALKNIHLKNKKKWQNSTLDAAIEFIKDCYTDGEGGFSCASAGSCLHSCDDCDIKERCMSILEV